MKYREKGDVRSLTQKEIKELKREQAEARQAEYDKLTVQQKIKRLDKKFGKGKGAKKERAKLEAKLNEKPKQEKSKEKEKREGNKK